MKRSNNTRQMKTLLRYLKRHNIQCDALKEHADGSVQALVSQPVNVQGRIHFICESLKLSDKEFTVGWEGALKAIIERPCKLGKKMASNIDLHFYKVALERIKGGI